MNPNEQKPEPNLENTQPTPPPVAPVSPFDQSATMPVVEQQKSSKKFIFAGLAFLVVALIAGVGAFLYFNQADSTDSQLSSADAESSGEDLGFRLLVPANLSWERPLLAKEAGQFAYSHNVEYGQGLVEGAYSFEVYPRQDSSYAPPENCGLPGDSTVVVPCVKYDGSEDIIAYTMNEQAFPGAIQNTAVESYITMYADIDGTVVKISSADTDAANLYSIITNMKEISADDLPESAVF